ncbi:hypothetical protein J6590_003895 [Homalodisca vitripennis]|nr:hypothetical protein J6590_003895 [Homalodisca vitripennis]
MSRREFAPAAHSVVLCEVLKHDLGQHDLQRTECFKNAQSSSRGRNLFDCYQSKAERGQGAVGSDRYVCYGENPPSPQPLPPPLTPTILY